jgi:hypothetical protein
VLQIDSSKLAPGQTKPNRFLPTLDRDCISHKLSSNSRSSPHALAKLRGSVDTTMDTNDELDVALQQNGSESAKIRHDFYMGDNHDTSTVQPDLIPMTVLTARFIQNAVSQRPLSALLDSGSTSTWISDKVLPANTTPSLGGTIACSTAAGILQSKRYVTLQDIILPDFARTKHIDCVQAHVFDAGSTRYDVILGRDFLSMIGIQLNFATHTMLWDEIE